MEQSRAVNAFFQAHAVEEFHRAEILSCLNAHRELVDGGDVFVAQCCSCARFADKAFARVSASLSDVDLNDLKATLRCTDVLVARYVTPIAPRPSW